MKFDQVALLVANIGPRQESPFDDPDQFEPDRLWRRPALGRAPVEFLFVPLECVEPGLESSVRVGISTVRVPNILGICQRCTVLYLGDLPLLAKGVLVDPPLLENLRQGTAGWRCSENESDSGNQQDLQH